MMEDKVCFITGASTALGKATAVGLAAQRATVVMQCRTESEADLLRYEVTDRTGSTNIAVLVGDLSDHTAARRIAREFKRQFRRLDVLLNLDVVTLRTRQLSADGVELTLATNLLGPFLLTYLLTDVLQNSAPARIINVVSEIHRKAEIYFDDIQLRRRYSAIRAARQSALARVMWTYELARLLQKTGVTANCFFPGLIRAENLHQIPWYVRPFLSLLYVFKGNTPEEAAASALYLATSPVIEDWSGRYFLHQQEAQSSWASYDKENARRLWGIAQQLTGIR